MQRAVGAMAALVVAGLGMAGAPALAGAPDDELHRLRRMAAEADAILIGEVEAVKKLGRDGDVETARARVKVKDWLAGGPGVRAWVTFDRKIGGAEEAAWLATKELVLFFLRKRLPGAPLARGIAAAPPPPDPAHDWVVQHAEDGALGHALPLRSAVEVLLRDAVALRGFTALRRFTAVGSPERAGLRAILWTETERVASDEPIAFRATFRNVGRLALKLPLRELLARAELEAVRVGDLAFYDEAPAERGPLPAEATSAAPEAVVLPPGAEHVVEFSISFDRLPRASVSPPSFGGVRDPFIPYERVLHKARDWGGAPADPPDFPAELGPARSFYSPGGLGDGEPEPVYFFLRWTAGPFTEARPAGTDGALVSNRIVLAVSKAATPTFRQPPEK